MPAHIRTVLVHRLTPILAVQFGLITDAKMCPDPEDIVENFAPEFEKLLLLALMSPWPALG